MAWTTANTPNIQLFVLFIATAIRSKTNFKLIIILIVFIKKKYI